jgi:hypothetical protein
VSDYRLPNGKVTRSATLYVREWRRMSRALGQLLDVETIAFDPDFLVKPKGGQRAHDIPMWLARKIIALGSAEQHG